MTRLSRAMPLLLSLALLSSCGGQRGGPALVHQDEGPAAVRLPPMGPGARGGSYTTFTQIRVPLSLFPDLDLAHISRLALLPTQSAPWEVLVSAVYGYQAEG